ncbi:hypothetical protein Dimus_015029 [Dionaea muscipula]
MSTRRETSLALAVTLLLSLTIFFTSVQSHPILNSFSFIKSLEGSQKGETVDGLEKLKCYLAHFGYLDRARCVNDHYNVTVDDEVYVLDDQKNLDESLEEAIKTYQLNFGLRVTGFMDRDTVNQMMKPRCGYPDIINGRNTMLARRDNPNYVLGPEKWHKSTFTYKFVHNDLAPVGIDSGAVLVKSYAEWARNCPLYFHRVPESVNSDFRTSFEKREHGDGAPFDGPGGILAHAGGPPSGVSHFDAEEHWSTNPVSGRFEVDLQAVMTHELGHILGLYHSADLAAVMYPMYDPNRIKRRLAKDDIDGIRALYG